MGDQVMKFSTLTTNGSKANYPTWRLIMDYEYELRRKAYKLITEEGYTLVGALQQVQKGESDLRHAFFTTPYQIQVQRPRIGYRTCPRDKGKNMVWQRFKVPSAAHTCPRGASTTKGRKARRKEKAKVKARMEVLQERRTRRTMAV